LCANKNFSWSWNPPRGRSGRHTHGSKYGKKLHSEHCSWYGNLYLKFELKNKFDSFEWVFTSVYGAMQEEEKDILLQEMVQKCSVESLPLMVGGDFNIISSPQDKNNNRYMDKWPFLFNTVINNLNLREIGLSRGQYRWANNLQIPT
jgi:hypothetical protein